MLKFICLLLILCHCTLAERKVTFLSTNVVFNPKYFKNYTLFIINNTMNMDMYLNRQIQRGFKAHIDYQLRLANAKNFQTVFSHNTDVCAIVTSVRDSLFKSWFLDMSKHGNFMYSCPVEIGHYYMRNWRMGGSMTHRFLMPGEYRGKAFFFYGKYKAKSYDECLVMTIDAILTN
ncbi:uncharacterized protein [Drosophila tropicalis]|uniref:uncharacterized protein n=1 Tax=Drosophila tropicalis TaxID=46794 RepID=UPI0035ABC892